MLMIAKHKFWRLLTRIHKWAGLIIGVQILLWFDNLHIAEVVPRIVTATMFKESLQISRPDLFNCLNISDAEKIAISPSAVLNVSHDRPLMALFPPKQSVVLQ